jgi:hypothetical protein
VFHKGPFLRHEVPMKSSVLFVLIVVLLFITQTAGVNNAQTSNLKRNWKQFKKCYFTFSAPRTLKDLKTKGTDSCVGDFEDENIKIMFDYGWYGGKEKKRDYMLDFHEQTIEIDGKPGQLTTYIFNDQPNHRNAKKYRSSIYVELGGSRENGNTVTSLVMIIAVKKKEDWETAKEIFKTIKF